MHTNLKIVNTSAVIKCVDTFERYDELQFWPVSNSSLMASAPNHKVTQLKLVKSRTRARRAGKDE